MYTSLSNRHDNLARELAVSLFGVDATVGRTGVAQKTYGNLAYLSISTTTDSVSGRTLSGTDSGWIDIVPKTAAKSYLSGTGDFSASKVPGALTGFDLSDDQLAKLEAASVNANETEFIQACQSVNWALEPAASYVRGVRLALSAGAHLVARKLAREGEERFPGHSELQKMASILAPPTVRRLSTPADPGLAANRDWLQSHRTSHKGQWAALHNGQLLGAAATVERLIAQVGKVKDQKILVTQVY